MKKIIFLMHTEWKWIKQRPHFIAEELAEDYEVHLIYKHEYFGRDLQKTPLCKKIIYHVFYKIPKIDRILFVRNLNNWILSLKIRNLTQKINPSAIYVCSPIFVNVLPTLYEGKVIYDCMDDHSVLVKNATGILDDEVRLIKRSTHVLASSNYLKNNILPNRECNPDKVVLVRNGFTSATKYKKNEEDEDGMFHIGYIGTISDWMDFTTIIQAVEANDKIVFHFAGPVRLAQSNIPKHDRIKLLGTIEHSQLSQFVRTIDCLCMTFLVNDIVKAVDPVKLYEYIDFGKNIICIRYEEVERFDEFVHFYSSTQEFIELIGILQKNNIRKYDDVERVKFLEMNTWKKREEIIKKIIG